MYHNVTPLMPNATNHAMTPREWRRLTLADTGAPWSCGRHTAGCNHATEPERSQVQTQPHGGHSREAWLCGCPPAKALPEHSPAERTSQCHVTMRSLCTLGSCPLPALGVQFASGDAKTPPHRLVADLHGAVPRRVTTLPGLTTLSTHF